MKTRQRRSSVKKRRTTRVRSSRKTTRVTVDFPDDEHRRLKALASLEGVSMQDYIRTHVMDKVNAMIEKFGGLSGIRDKNLLASALEAPKATFGGFDLTCIRLF